MYLLLKFLHLAAAIVWMGGMFFMLWAMRPVVAAQLPPTVRLPLLQAILGRFFLAVWISIALLLLTGSAMLGTAGMKNAPVGWHLMLGTGLLMCALFGHLFFGPFRRLKLALAAGNLPEAGRRMAQIGRIVTINFCLGWLGIAAAYFMH